MRLSHLCAVAVTLALAGCGHPGSLTDLKHLQATLVLGGAADGSAHLFLDYPVDAPSQCKSLDLVASWNGTDFDWTRGGEWAATQLAGSADHCVFPEAFLAHRPPDARAVVEVLDGSTTVELDLSHGDAARRVDLQPPSALHAGDRLDVPLTTVVGDVATQVQVEAFATGTGGCGKFRLFLADAKHDDLGWYLTVPDLLAPGTDVSDCHGPVALAQGVPLDVELDATARLDAPAEGCQGAERCAVVVETGGKASSTLVP